LNIFISACLGGKINLYTIPKFELFRSFDLNYFSNYISISPKLKNVFVSHSPLACFTIITNDNMFVSFSINGEKLKENQEEIINNDQKFELITSEINQDELFSENLVKYSKINLLLNL